MWERLKSINTDLNSYALTAGTQHFQTFLRIGRPRVKPDKKYETPLTNQTLSVWAVWSRGWPASSRPPCGKAPGRRGQSSPRWTDSFSSRCCFRQITNQKIFWIKWSFYQRILRGLRRKGDTSLASLKMLIPRSLTNGQRKEGDPVI